MGLFKRLLKRSVREAREYTPLIVKSYYPKYDFIGEKKNMKFDFDKYEGDRCRIGISSEKEFDDFIDTLQKYAELSINRPVSVEVFRNLWEPHEGYYYYEGVRVISIYPEPPRFMVHVHKCDICLSHDAKIIRWSDFMKIKKFTRDDIRVWDIVKRADGTTAIINLVHGELVLQLQTGYRHVLKHAYDLDLTSTKDTKADIVAVRRVDNVRDLRYNVFEEELGCLVWKRDEPIVEMTMEDVCKALGKRVKIVDGK